MSLDQMDIEATRRDLAYENFVRRAHLAKVIIQDVQAETPFGIVVRRAEEAAVQAVKDLIDVDLFTKEGIGKARSAQAEARRYRDIAGWLDQELQGVVAEAEEREAPREEEDLRQANDDFYRAGDGTAPDHSTE